MISTSLTLILDCLKWDPKEDWPLPLLHNHRAFLSDSVTVLPLINPPESFILPTAVHSFQGGIYIYELKMAIRSSSDNFFLLSINFLTTHFIYTGKTITKELHKKITSYVQRQMLYFPS